ncbi:Uncharacterised protein [Mycobacteroides abscessus subsp. abscessus]|nr:Uncharacterised protein [Mycobacteroides abscessus subsp. abscessus]
MGIVDGDQDRLSPRHRIQEFEQCRGQSGGVDLIAEQRCAEKGLDDVSAAIRVGLGAVQRPQEPVQAAQRSAGLAGQSGDPEDTVAQRFCLKLGRGE